MVIINTSPYSGQITRSGKQRKQRIPYDYSKHSIHKELQLKMEENGIYGDARETFLLAVIQQQATELDRFKKSKAINSLEANYKKLTEDVIHTYDKNVDITIDKELRNHYFELREKIKEMKKLMEQIEASKTTLND